MPNQTCLRKNSRQDEAGNDAILDRVPECGVTGGGASIAWVESEIDDFLENIIAQRG